MVRTASLGCRVAEIVDERIDALEGWVRLAVEGGVEQRVWVKPFCRSAHEVVHDRVEPGLIEVDCLDLVVLWIEEARARVEQGRRRR